MSCAGHQREAREKEATENQKVALVIENVRVKEIPKIMEFIKKLRKNAAACLKFLEEE